MDMKKVITIGALAFGFLAWRMGAMQQGQNQIEIVPKDGPAIRIPLNTACLSGTIKALYDDFKDENGTLTEPISLAYISTADLNVMLVTEVPYILGVHAAYNNGASPTAAVVNALPENVRKERAQRAAHAMNPTKYDQALLKATMDRFNAAVYLNIPELYERYARMIADMLICDACLAELSRNAAILNEFTVALEAIIAHYIPEPWLEVCTLREYTGLIMAASFSPDGTRVVTASADNTAKIWDAETGENIRNLVGHTDMVRSASFSPDGTRVVTASDDRTAKIWNAATGALVRNLEGHNGYVYSAAFSPDGSKIVTISGDNTAKIWNAVTGVLVRNIGGTARIGRSAEFSPDSTRVVTGSFDKKARIWNAATGQKIRNLVGHTSCVNSAAFSPDGTRVVTASGDNTAKIWDAATGANIRNLVGHTDMVNSASFSPDGTRVLTASDDKTAKIWNAATGELVRDFVGHTRPVNSAAFSRDGRKIVASVDKTAMIWQLLPTSLPGVNDLDAALFIRLLFWAKKHQRINDKVWAPKVVRGIEWNSIPLGDRTMLQGWIREAGM